MKLSSVLNKFRKNGLQFEQVESGSAFYICKHDLVENTYVQVLAKSNGVDVSTMAIVQKYDEQCESKTFFSTIAGLLESFMLDVKNAEQKAQTVQDVANIDECFTVKRERLSVTQGYVKVFYNDTEVIEYGDDIQLISDGSESHGDNIGGWASVVSDREFIDGIKKRPTKILVKLLENQIENTCESLASNFEIDYILEHHVNIFYKDSLLIAIPFIKRKSDEFYFKIAQLVFKDKINI